MEHARDSGEGGVLSWRMLGGVFAAYLGTAAFVGVSKSQGPQYGPQIWSYRMASPKAP